MAGVEFWIAPTRLFSMPSLPMPKRLLRTQSITVAAWALSATSIDAMSEVLAALAVEKSTRAVPAGLLV
jgi:hypothetical protein